jgi:hypothetical protein
MPREIEKKTFRLQEKTLGLGECGRRHNGKKINVVVKTVVYNFIITGSVS